MEKFNFKIEYDSTKEELHIGQEVVGVPTLLTNDKYYNKIITPGDVGTACKDYVMELISKGKV